MQIILSLRRLHYELSIIRTLTIKLCSSFKRELAHLKIIPNKNDHVRTKTETNESNIAQSVRLSLVYSGVHLVYNFAGFKQFSDIRL
jgi:hypothetical protein